MPFWFSGYTQSVPVDILWEEMGEEEKMMNTTEINLVPKQVLSPEV